MNDMSPLKAIRQRWWIVVAFAIVGTLVGGLPQPEQIEEQATTFTATHTLLANGGGDGSIISVSQVPLLATAGEVPIRVAEQINFDGSPPELASQVEVIFDFETSALTISTERGTAEQAEMISNAFADQLNTYLTERQDEVYNDRLAASRNRVLELTAELNEITSELGQTPDDPILLAERDAVSRQYAQAYEQNDDLERGPSRLSFTTLERAQALPQVDRGLSAPASRTTRATMGFVVGGALGVALALLLGRLDRKIRSREQAEDLVGMRARVIIPSVRDTDGGIVVSPGRHDPLSDSYRTIRNVVGFVQNGLQPSRMARITLVVSPGAADGKTSLTANLAEAFTELGQRTIVVNSDFRRPRLHNALTGSPAPELPYDLDELDQLPRRALPLNTLSDNMKILDLSSIPGSPGQLARATARQIERVAGDADQIVIDSSPVGATAEVLDLVPLADVIVLVARVGSTSISATEQTIAILRDIAEAPIVFVLGGVRSERSQYHEYSDRRPATASAPGAPLDPPRSVAEPI
jgi:Mrp family chromosome partitioning ATPase